MEEENSGNTTSNITSKVIYVTLAIALGIAGFYLGRWRGYDTGYFDGAIFGDSSGYKRGQTVGFELGYQLSDSIAEQELLFRSSQDFNLNIINDELQQPEKYITLSGEISDKKVQGSYFTATYAKYVKVTISSGSQFARYKDIAIKVKYLGNRSELLKEASFNLEETLYPKKKIILDIPPEEVPQTLSKVEAVLIEAIGVD